MKVSQISILLFFLLSVLLGQSVFFNLNTQTLKCADPTFNPAAGTYTVTQNVTPQDSTSGVTYCYSVDGSTVPAADTPGTCSTGSTYSTPIVVSATTTIKVLATKVGHQNSNVVTGLFTITPQNSDTFSGTVGTALATHNPNWVNYSSTYVVSGFLLTGSNSVKLSTVWANSGAMYNTSTSDTIQITEGPHVGASTGSIVCVRAITGPSNSGYCISFTGHSGSSFPTVTLSYNGGYRAGVPVNGHGPWEDSVSHTMKLQCLGDGASAVCTTWIDGQQLGNVSGQAGDRASGVGHPMFYFAGAGTDAKNGTWSAFQDY